MRQPLNAIVELKRCWRRKLTGALFLKSDDNELIQAYFNQGELIHIHYGGFLGEDAIKKIPSFSLSKVKFHDGAISKTKNTLPTTESIIHSLEENEINHSEIDFDNNDTITASTKTRLENAVIDILGPMGEIIFNEKVVQCTTTNQLIAELCNEIPKQDQKTFLDAIKLEQNKNTQNKKQ